MYTPKLEPKGKKQRTNLKTKWIYRDSRLTIKNCSGLLFKLLLLCDYYWGNIVCSYTYDNGLGIIRNKKLTKNTILRDLYRHEATTAGNTPLAESGGTSKAGHEHETACREVDLSSCNLQDGSKPGLNRTSRPMRRQSLHIYLYMYSLYMY